MKKKIDLQKRVQDLGDVRKFNPLLDQNELYKAIDHFEKTGIVSLVDPISSMDWKKFVEDTERVGIVIMESYTPDWKIPDRISVVRYDPFMMRLFPKIVEYSHRNIQYKREVTAFQNKGFCMIGKEYHRCNFAQILYAFGLDQDLDLYHPAYPKTYLENDFFSINNDIKACEDKKLRPHHRFDFIKNLDVVKPQIIKNDLEIVISNRFVHEPGGINEKNLYGAIFGIPSFQIVSVGLQELIKSYGFKFIYPEGKNLIRSGIEWISLFCRLSNEQRQRFQEDQGENVIQNHKALCNLENILIEQLEDDLRKL